MTTKRVPDPGAKVFATLAIIGLVYILLRIALFVFSLWALIFGIVDTAEVGANTWSLLWMISGAIGLALSLGLFGRRKG